MQITPTATAAIPHDARVSAAIETLKDSRAVATGWTGPLCSDDVAAASVFATRAATSLQQASTNATDSSVLSSAADLAFDGAKQLGQAAPLYRDGSDAAMATADQASAAAAVAFAKALALLQPQ